MSHLPRVVPIPYHGPPKILHVQTGPLPAVKRPKTGAPPPAHPRPDACAHPRPGANARPESLRPPRPTRSPHAQDGEVVFERLATQIRRSPAEASARTALPAPKPSIWRSVGFFAVTLGASLSVHAAYYL